MGTNYYKVLEFSESEKEIVKKAYEEAYKHHIEDGECHYDDSQSVNELPKHRIHLGKCSCGWQFLWNHNEGKYFQPSIDSIKEFLNKPGYIVDEYYNKFTPEEFLEEIQNHLWGKGKHCWNNRSYYLEHSNEYNHWTYQHIDIWGENFDCLYGDFLVNGLRFSYHTEFS